MYRQQHNFSKWRAVSGFAEGSNMKHNSPDPACAMELHRQCSTYSYFIIHKIIANPLRKISNVSEIHLITKCHFYSNIILITNQINFINTKL